MTESAADPRADEERPVAASYCATFLKPEMLHIYRQITALRHFRPIVIARKRENAERFPFRDVTVVPKPSTHFLRRIWYRQIRDVPWHISRREVGAIMSVLDREKAQLLHIYFGHIAVHLLPLIRAWPRPIVVSFHGADVMVDLEKPAYRAAAKEMLQTAQLVFIRSESLGRALLELGCSERTIRLQRTGIPLGELPYQPREWAKNGMWKFLQVGRLIEKKGLRTSLRAFAQFAKQFPAATFTIAGEGPLRGALEAEARDLGVERQVTFTGFVSQSELRALFSASHIFLHPSEIGADGNQEGVPNSMLEAMASGLPVFATRHGGIPEAIENGVSGVLVTERDVEGLSRELLSSVAAPERLSEMAKAGAAAVAQKFEQSAQIRKLEEFYAEAIRTPLDQLSASKNFSSSRATI